MDGRHRTGGIRYGQDRGGGGVFVVDILCRRGRARVERVAGSSRRDVGLSRGAVPEGIGVGGQWLRRHRRAGHLYFGGHGAVVAGPRMRRQILVIPGNVSRYTVSRALLKSIAAWTLGRRHVGPRHLVVWQVAVAGRFGEMLSAHRLLYPACAGILIPLWSGLPVCRLAWSHTALCK